MRVTILTLLFFTPYCLSTVNGLSIREATEATIDETMTVFSNIAEDKNFTNFQPEINNKTQDVTIFADGPVEVINNQTEKEKAKVNIVEPSSSTTTNTTSKPIDAPSIPSTTTSTTTTTTTSPVPSTSSSPLNTSISPIISPLNDTNPIIDLSAVNDTIANNIFTDFEKLLADLNATSNENGIDTAAGGVSGGSPDEFASYFELLDKLDGLEVLFEPDQ